MGKINIQQRKLVVKAGMTVDDIKKSKDATAMQKKYASAFDTDGQTGFSQKEADLFNATTFSEKADGTVMFWTRQKDGTKKGTKFNSKDNIQYKSENEVKPYLKKVTVKKSAPKKEESVSFFDEKWSGHQIAKITGDNVVTDWLQDKDKVCTDGKDDGKISFWEGTKSFVKGLVGGIPKAMINHPVATVVTVAAGAAAIAITGGAIVPILGAAGVVTGVGMAGYGGYKAATAKTDGEAKQALETMGMGVTTTALSVATADKVLEQAANAGVKSAQVSEDAGIIDKTIQMFKATPEALKVSAKNIKSNISASFGVASSESSAIASNESIAKQKLQIEKQLKSALSKNAKKCNLGKDYKDAARIQKVLDSINEDNIDFALKLLDERIGYNNTSIYTKYAEENCDYLLKTMPRLLKSNNINVQRAAEYIIESPEICDKLFVLNVLNEDNALEIMSIKGLPTKDLFSIRAAEDKRDFLRSLMFKKPLERQELEPTIQEKLWKLYTEQHEMDELLPFIEDASHKDGNQIYLKIYAKEGTKPNIPGVKVEYCYDESYHVVRTKYVLYESASDKQHNLQEAQSIAQGLLKEFGYESIDLDCEKAIALMKNGCKTQEERQWLADFILSDKYKLIQEKK